MYLQGNLQVVFDALYHMGVIDPVLEMDWQEAMQEFHLHYERYRQAVQIANSHQDDVSTLIQQLEGCDETSLGYLAIEVARELADFHSRQFTH